VEITIRFVLPRVRRRFLVAGIVSILALAPTAALASHLFGDVPNSHTFHGDVAAIAGAGITVGCGGGNFCPDSPITRGQEAAFLTRGLGRVAGSVTTLDSSISAADGWVTIAAVNVDVPGVDGGQQRVVVDGEVTAVTDSNGINNCGLNQRCYINTRIRNATSGVSSSPGFYAYSPDTYHQELVGREAMFLVGSGDHRFELQVDLINGGDSILFASPTIIAMTFPFDGTGAPPAAPGAGSATPAAQLNGGR
jgi:hypothetical protein